MWVIIAPKKHGYVGVKHKKQGVMRLEGIILEIIKTITTIATVLIVAVVKANFKIKISLNPFKIEIKKEVVR